MQQGPPACRTNLCFSSQSVAGEEIEEDSSLQQGKCALGCGATRPCLGGKGIVGRQMCVSRNIQPLKSI